METDQPPVGDPSRELERALFDEFYRAHGYDSDKLRELDAFELRSLTKQASEYASLKLAEVELRARYIRDIHGDAETAHTVLK